MTRSIISRHLVDPQLTALLEQFPARKIDAALLPLLRANPLAMPDTGEGIGKVKISKHFTPGLKGAPDVELRVYQPLEAKGLTGCILHIHGGGYVMGSAASGEPTHRALSDRLGCAIVSVEYRLAPETRAPGAVEDCYAALAWLNAHAAELGVDPARIGVMGESAGGGLAAALALYTRDKGEFRLAFQHLIYPMLDDRTCATPDPHPHAGEFIWTPDSNHFGWSSLLGVEPGSPEVSCYAAPARAESLAGLPPTFINCGALDLFIEEDLDYARRLIRSGVPVELHVYPGAYHAFNLDQTAQVSKAARADLFNALKKALS